MHKSVLSLVCCLFFFLSCQEEIETMPNGSLNIVLTDEAAVTRTLPEAPSFHKVRSESFPMWKVLVYHC